MNYTKIDKSLLSKVNTLSDEQKIECIVKAYDYQRLKKFILSREIEVLHEYLFINSLWVKVSPKELLKLSKLTQVEYIFSVGRAATLMHVARKILNVNTSHLTGKGITIAFIDTGISKHCDFLLCEKRITYFRDFVSNEEREPYDDNGHGTFVAGVCSGSGAMSGGKFCGIAPKAQIISLKALNEGGEATADRILSAMEWVYLNHSKYNIKVVCMSFGSEPIGYNDPIMSGAEALWKKGIVVVAAAGNSGPEYQTIKSPGVSSEIITVGGFDDNRLEDDKYDFNFFEIADFSSRGPAFQRFKPDLVAPSVDIVSCGLKYDYVKLSGTSVATPMVAGMVALYLEENPLLTPIQIKKKLLSTCKSISFNKNIEGYGYPFMS